MQNKSNVVNLTQYKCAKQDPTPIAFHFMYYKRAKGIGMSIKKGGIRKFGIDWHRFTLNGKQVNRPHYHRGKLKSQIEKKHRPWQGGW